MKKRMLTLPGRGAVSGSAIIRPRTGEHCPANGWWAPLNRGAAAQFLTEGSIMPADGGTAVIWAPVERSGRELTPRYDYPVLRLPADSY